MSMEYAPYSAVNTEYAIAHTLRISKHRNITECASLWRHETTAPLNARPHGMNLSGIAGDSLEGLELP
jgi:hypothetical protein